jgi:hypothetical protein
MEVPMISPISGAVLLILTAATPVPSAECDDPLPLDPAVITKEMSLKSFSGANQMGPVCHLSWEGGKGASLMIYGPTAMAGLGRKFTSPKQAAEQYKGESPKGVEPVPGLIDAYMVFDPKTPNRRVFVERNKKVYMIVSQDQVPLEVLAKACRPAPAG